MPARGYEFYLRLVNPNPNPNPPTFVGEEMRDENLRVSAWEAISFRK